MPATVDPAVVEFVADREGISEEAARRQAEDEWRLARAYLEDHGGAPPSTARREHLERSALARLWLREDFERRYDLASIPAEAVAEALADPHVMHPRVHVVCQAIVSPLPDDDGTPRAAPDDPGWRAAAEAEAEALADRLRRYLRHPELEKDCSQLQRVIGLSPDPTRDDMRIHEEAGVFETCREDRWDEGFVAALCTRDDPGVVGPFWTRYGAHVAVVIDVEEDNRPDGEAAQDRAAREVLLPSWRTSQYPEYIARLRARLDVRRVEVSP